MDNSKIIEKEKLSKKDINIFLTYHIKEKRGHRRGKENIYIYHSREILLLYKE
jgi:hypothetical protein